MSRAVGHESLDMPKFSREILDMGRKSLCPDFRDPCPDFRDQILVCPDFRDPWRVSCPAFPELMSRLYRLKLSARLCNLVLNPDAAQSLARLCPDFLPRLKLST